MISIIFLAIIIISWNFVLKAKNLENEKNSTLISKSKIRLSYKDFNLGQIEVISEPLGGQNININYSMDPAIAIENDKIYVVWNDKTNISNNGADYDIFFRYFDGGIWSEIQVISEPVHGKDISQFGSVLPDIVVKNNKIYVVWKDYNNISGADSDADIFYRCNITGKNWEDIQVISEPVQGQNINKGDCIWPKIAVENGKIYVVWEDNNNTNYAGTDWDIFYRCNLTGSDWEDIQIISEPIFGANENTGDSEWPDIAVDNNKIYVVWNDNNDTQAAGTDSDIFYICNLTGSSWETVQVISEPVKGNDVNTVGSYFPSIAVEDGKIYVVWHDLNNTNGAGTDLDIFYRCNLTGSNWETVQIISEPIKGQDFNKASSSHPEIAVENGNIYVVWDDSNNTKSASGDLDIFYRCNFTGSSWEDVQVISEPVSGSNLNTGQSSWPDIAVNLGKSHIVWNDNNDTNGSDTDDDIFYRWIKDPLPLYLGYPSVLPNSGNTSTKFNFTITYTHLKNKPPIELTVNISGIEYSMLEVDSTDTNYTNGKDYFFNIKNLSIGTHTCQFHTSDGEFSWSTPVVNKPIVYNTPPNIITNDNLTAFEDVYYEVDYEYEDIDIANVAQPGYWNFSTDANWLKFNHTTAILNGTPEDDDVGEYWVNITINDTMEIDFTNFTLTVININDPPIIITDDIEITYEDEFYEVDYDAFDIDTPENNLIWTMDTNASWLRFESTTAVLNGTPENDDVGEYWIKISVSDSEYMDYSNFTLKVINVNDPPKITTEDNITAFEDELYEMDYEAEDVDNTPNELTWAITSNARWIKIDTTNSIINGTPTNDDIGEYWVNISVSDNEYLDFTNFTLTVVNTNDPPSIITEDKTNVTVGELYSVNYEAEDIDPVPTTLTWSLKTNASNWLTIDKITGWLNGVSAKGDAGVYWVNVSVSDNENGLDYHNFTLQVIKLPTKENSPPMLSNASMTPLEGDVKTEFTFSVHYYDKDGDTPIFIEVVIDNRAYNMNLKAGENASNGTYEYRIILTEGTHTYYFMASDGLEMVKTDNSTSPEIKKVEKISEETGSWYWIIGVTIVVIIIVLLTFMFIYKKYRAAKIPTVRAELLYAPPEHITFPGVTPGVEGVKPLPMQPTVSEQLITPTMQAQPTIAAGGEKAPVPTLAPTPVTSQFQLPKDTLTKEQQLGLLQERFLRGEVSEETYKELKAKLESGSDGDITGTEEEIKEQTISDEGQQIKSQQEPQESTDNDSGQSSSKGSLEPDSVAQQPQASAQDQEQRKFIEKEQTDDDQTN